MSAIPIIGQTRSWKDIGFGGKPILKPASILEPSYEVTGFQIALCGTRSDDLPVTVVHVVDYAHIGGDIFGVAMRVMAAMVTQFESYRTCNCVPHHPCHVHEPKVKTDS